MSHQIWALGGGKGGTGKSFISSGLGYHLARTGKETVLIDADFGAPNLHTFFGLTNTSHDLGDFLSSKISSIQEIAEPLILPNLKLVKGPESLLFTANLNYYKKLKFLRQVNKLKCDHVILDLGTGTSLNTLDFFLTADPGLVILTPEATAIENGIIFLKSCAVRALKLYLEHFEQAELLQRLEIYIKDNSKTFYGFFKSLAEENSRFGYTLYLALKKFRPCLIMNKVRNDRDEQLGQSLVDGLRKFLLIDVRYLGSVPYDDRVSDSLKDFTFFYQKYEGSEISLAVNKIASKLMFSADFITRRGTAPVVGMSS